MVLIVAEEPLIRVFPDVVGFDVEIGESHAVLACGSGRIRKRAGMILTRGGGSG
jgi:hypothetical protein